MTNFSKWKYWFDSVFPYTYYVTYQSLLIYMNICIFINVIKDILEKICEFWVDNIR